MSVPEDSFELVSSGIAVGLAVKIQAASGCGRKVSYYKSKFLLH